MPRPYGRKQRRTCATRLKSQTGYVIAAVLPRMIVDTVWLSICVVASRLTLPNVADVLALGVNAA
jgi:hypothetical protein